MLNELLAIEQGMKHAGFASAVRHPDVNETRSIPTLIVVLGEGGTVERVRPLTLPRDVRTWTLRNGKHNSFPFHQLSHPLLRIDANREEGAALKSAVERTSECRREALVQASERFAFYDDAFDKWPNSALIKHVDQRSEELALLRRTDSELALTTFERFVAACRPPGAGRQLLHAIVERLTERLQRGADDEFVEAAAALLLGKYEAASHTWSCNGGLLFEAGGYDASIVDSRVSAAVSDALLAYDRSQDAKKSTGRCGLTGRKESLVTDKFPAPNVPLLGETYLFAKNSASKANERYGRSSTDSMPVGGSIANELAGVLRALTARNLEGKTWRSVPGEAPKQADLLLAFVDGVLDAPLADAVASDADFDDTSSDEGSTADSIATFIVRATRVLEAVKAKVEIDFRKTLVRFAILRKIDPANRKVVYSDSLTLGRLYDAAVEWEAGERNLPDWLALPVPVKRSIVVIRPPHVAPLGIIAFSRRHFLRGGIESSEVAGIPASEALPLFLESPKRPGDAAWRRDIRTVGTILTRRGALVSGAAHALRKGLDFVKPYDRYEALRTATVLGVLLYKIGRTKEEYMMSAAFRLGQLLASLDVVHAGYCADVRGGDVPPSLLGNQVFATAQSSPTKALSVVAQRWKPYGAWADRARLKSHGSSSEPAKSPESQRTWDVRKAIRAAREVKSLADELSGQLNDCRADDVYRAELLLGYLAGNRPASRTSAEEAPRFEAGSDD
jgi:hypothetical protein